MMGSAIWRKVFEMFLKLALWVFFMCSDMFPSPFWKDGKILGERYLWI
jgi:hypothetical protein